MGHIDKWIVCASGASMLSVDTKALKRFHSWRVLVINNTWELIPWADAMYAADLQWWDEYDTSAFQGQKWTMNAAAAKKHKARHIAKCEGVGLCRENGWIHSGGNSGYQALNLAYHLGAKRIVMLGYDMHRRNGGHWHGEHKNLISAPQAQIEMWLMAFPALAADFLAAGVDVVNATPGSALECFPKMDLMEALHADF